MYLIRSEYPASEVARVIEVLVDDARSFHGVELNLNSESYAGHTSLTEEPLSGRDVPC